MAIATSPASPTPAPPLTINFVVRRRVTITAALALCAVIYQVVARKAPLDAINFANPWLVVAYAAILSGLLVRSWAAGNLVKCVTLTQSGPYALVRHPLYSGSFLLVLGFAILSGSWLSVALVVGPLVYIYSKTVSYEERLLTRQFGGSWHTYATKTPRLIPNRLPAISELSWSLARWRANGEYNAWLGALGVIGGLIAVQALT
jgi:protein-S-isoprenylcysteine O-methyltransferase Ste14